MKLGRILNKDLNELIACMGHGDFIIVCDAGFPIPRDAWRIDLAIEKDVPDTSYVLEIIKSDLMIEKIAYAEDVKTYNDPLYQDLQRLFPGIEHEQISHESILSEMAGKAKAIVRTGAFNPWGNVLLYTGVEVPRWFAKEGVVAPDYYKDRL
ncbi:MAG TPA: D-ribose pyranase [Desulfosporosinus sp.]|nr:D-ribose pyranase [Desulfosporosinus sp.]